MKNSKNWNQNSLEPYPGLPQAFKMEHFNVELLLGSSQVFNAWKVSQYRVFSSLYFPVFGPEKAPYLDTFHAVLYLQSLQNFVPKFLQHCHWEEEVAEAPFPFIFLIHYLSKKYVFEKLYLWSQAVLAFNRKVGKTIRISKFCNRNKKVLKLIELNVRKSVRSPKELFTLLNIIFFPIVYTLLLNYWYCFYLFTMSF